MKFETITSDGRNLQSYLNGVMFFQGPYTFIQCLEYKSDYDWTILVRVN